MDTIISVQKAIVLNADQYGHWKARMKQMIRGINEDAWTAVEIGWEEPTIVTGGEKKPKPKRIGQRQNAMHQNLMQRRCR